MAYSGQRNSSVCYTQDSDEVQEMYCEHCDKHDKKYVPAKGFCVDCAEYLCDMCLKYHNRYVASHMLKDKDSMQQDFCLQKCSIHKDELVKFYCQVCEKLACSECKKNDHRNCKTVSHLPTLVDGIEKSKELKDLTENMDELLQDSDAVQEIYCEHCDKHDNEVQEMYCEHCDKHDKKYVPAEGFCVDCVEYLCAMCLKYHKRYVPSHTFKDKDSMPQDFCLEECSIHKDELVKFYCQPCQKFACSKCKANDHRNCKSLSPLPTLVNGIEKSEELKDLTENMDELLQELESITENVNTKMERATSQERKVLEVMKQKKEEILSAYKAHQQIIDNFEKKMEEPITRLKEENKTLIIHSEEKKMTLEKKLTDEEDEIKMKVKNTKEADQNKLQSIKEKSLTIRKDLKTFSSDLVQHQNTGQRCKLFFAMKNAKQSIGKLKYDSSKLKENNEIHYYTAECKMNKQDVINTENTGRVFCLKELHHSERERIAHYHCDLQVRTVIWSSLCLLSENTLLVTNSKSSSLIIVRDMNVSTIQMPVQPWAAARVEDNKVAVTLPRNESVRLMTFSDSMTVINREDIKVGARCRGIAYSNNNLIVSYTTTPAKVQILDMSGKVLKCFDKDCNGQKLFGEPLFLAISPDNTIIYVSDKQKNMVLSMTMDGKVKATYMDNQLIGPSQLAVDRSGAVYVCGRGSHNVHQLTPDLTKVKILLDKGQGMDLPASVAYCQNKNRLYVGLLLANIIKVFNLTLE